MVVEKVQLNLTFETIKMTSHCSVFMCDHFPTINFKIEISKLKTFKKENCFIIPNVLY